MSQGLRLRTQLLLVVAFVELYTIGVGLSYWVQAQAQERLERSFRDDLAVLTKLPQLRDTLRRLDETTAVFLLEGKAGALERRQDALIELRGELDSLAPLMESADAGKRLASLQNGLAGYVAQEEQWIALRQSRRVSPADAERLAAMRMPLERLIMDLSVLKDVSVLHLRERRQVVRRASIVALCFVLLTGLVSSLLLALFLARYMIHPILRLERFASRWRLGEPWAMPPGPAGPEVEHLIGRMADMAQRLNQQFLRERELAELKTQLVGMVTHEFNNAMTVIVGVTALLEDSDGEPPERRRHYYELIKANVRALTQATSNLLNMGRLESGRFALSPRRVELRSVLEPCAERLELLARQKSLTVSLELPEPPAPVRADPEALTLVATNLLSNAIKYTPEGGAVTLGVRRAGGGAREVEVYCRDSGIGISEEDKRRILAGYYRTESGKRAAKGFGVGLALANSLVEAHGSRFEIESAPGKGSTFLFRLPLWEDGAPEPQPASPAPPAPSSITPV